MDTVKIDPPMPEENKCPQCGTPLSPSALGGLCPACLLKMGAAADTVTDAKQPPFNPPSVTELAPLFPQLEILELIGKGGMGAVYKARQKQLDRIVALKILPPGIGHDAAFAERFAREAKALAKLNHPNIVTLYEFGNASGQFYFLMEFVDGLNLRQLLAGSRIAPREALAIVPQICDALQFAHDQGIVHRDIKPENILLDRRGRVKVADFGLAKIIEDRDATTNSSATEKISENLTDAGKTMGTPNYMSPEQITAPGEVDHRADIYALGVVFYQMLTGELPGKKIAPPSTKVQIDVRLDEIVLRALEKNPELRYQQVSEVKTGVEMIGVNAPVEKSENQEPHLAFIKIPLVILRAGKPVTNWPAVFVTGALMALLMAGGMAIAAAIGIPDALARRVLLLMVLPVVALIPLWLFLEIGAGHRALAQGAQTSPLFAKRKNRLHRLVGQLLAAFIIAFFLRTFFITSYHAETRAAAPEIPRGSHFFVWKLAHNFAPGDLIAYRKENDVNIGRVVGRDQNGFLLVNRNGETDFAVPPHDVLGKVISVYWRAAGKKFNAKVPSTSCPPFLAHLTNAEVELIAIGDQPWSNTVCWLANGEISNQPFPIGSGSMDSWGPNKVTKKLAFRIHNENLFGISYPVCRVNESSGVLPQGSGLESPAPRADGRFTQLIACPTNAATVDITLGLANGAWETAINLSHREHNYLHGAEEFNSVNEGDWSATYNAVAGRDNVAITCNYSKNTNWESRMVCVSDTGKITSVPENSTGFSPLSTGGILLVSSNEFTHIKEFQLQRRKYQWVEFSNVSLQPGHVTVVKVKNSGGEIKNTQPMSAAQDWLALMDIGAFSQSWETAGFHQAFTKDAWVKLSEQVREPLGKMISRKIISAQSSTIVTEMPRGAYFTVQFETSFAELTNAVETVQLSQEKDGGWKTIYYLIRQRTTEETAAVTAAQKWLAGIDAGNYAASWTDAAESFRNALSQDKWVQALESVRSPLGKLEIRTVDSTVTDTEMPGAPDGKYVVMQFQTAFADKNSAVETVTFSLEKSGQWQASGYYIK